MLGDGKGVSKIFASRCAPSPADPVLWWERRLTRPERKKGLSSAVGPLANDVFYDSKDRNKDAHILFRCGDGPATQSVKKPHKWHDKYFRNRFPL